MQRLKYFKQQNILTFPRKPFAEHLTNFVLQIIAEEHEIILSVNTNKNMQTSNLTL